MCVKLLKAEKFIEYDYNTPLIDQINGCKEVLVKYQPNDKEVEKFLLEMQKFAKTGFNPNIKIKVEYNDFLHGYKTKKQLTKAMNDISLNEVIKLVTLMQRSIDRTLEEIAQSCAQIGKNG